MTDRIEAAAAELRPLLQNFILWARENAPGSDSNLVGSVALWHRLIASDDVGRWRQSDLRTVLLDRMPQVVEDPDAAADGMVPAIRAYLTFLSESDRLAKGSAPLGDLLAELDRLEDDFVDAMEDLVVEEDEDDEYDDEEESEGLGDFEPFADELSELPTIRLRPDSELAAATRRAPLISKARDLAVWVGSERRVGETSLLDDAEITEALAALGLPVPEKGDKSLADSVPALWNIWNLAIDLDFLQPEGEDTVSVDADTAEWPFEEDDDALDAWMAGLHSIDYGDPELEDEEATIALSGLTRALLVRVLLATGSKPLAELRTELAEAAAEYDDLGTEAWAAATAQYGDPLNPVLDWLAGYGMVEVEHDQVRLTPLGMEGVVHLVDDADIELDARPAIDAMTALDLLSFGSELPEEEADAEFEAWMELRAPEQAARDLLEAAAEDDANALIRVQAASMVGSLGEVAIPAWREALDEPSLRPYAATHLAQLGVEDAPPPTQADTHWLILDMLTISAGLGRPEFVSSLDDIGNVPNLVSLLEVIWKVPHPHLEELLEAIGKAHPDKQVGKAAKRALFKARSGQN
ncbi:hypothetical protein OG884_08950 [Streptosporangium sp. NBC_01755]|uniref:hypothetical protein n=1 Tax=unclassified Streptosporangium TaxID=2632669 RepID=UPI002DDA2069|nr:MULTISPECIES: hypothetical protein [unclassified Streptosporangium]WSA26550.1 hypothetical protein OIE13_01210 [Streptosporangium sp. NBC_01810]WSD02027.1 hypothetical protein OG884_08950 [Streptosporangium sp. NBC_01755]